MADTSCTKFGLYLLCFVRFVKYARCERSLLSVECMVVQDANAIGHS